MVIYDKVDIVFQEIPNEVSLSFTIMGCPNRCPGCHSAHLTGDNGNTLDMSSFVKIFEKYKDSITTVLFLGGDANPKLLIPFLEYTLKNGKKTAMYSGMDFMDWDIAPYLKYYKVGSYKEDLGPLSSPTTNQRLYKITNDGLINITKLFQTK